MRVSVWTTRVCICMSVYTVRAVQQFLYAHAGLFVCMHGSPRWHWKKIGLDMQTCSSTKEERADSEVFVHYSCSIAETESKTNKTINKTEVTMKRPMRQTLQQDKIDDKWIKQTKLSTRQNWRQPDQKMMNKVIIKTEQKMKRRKRQEYQQNRTDDDQTKVTRLLTRYDWPSVEW